MANGYAAFFILHSSSFISLNDSPAQHTSAAIEHGCLAGRDARERLAERHVQAAVGTEADRGVVQLFAVAYLDFHFAAIQHFFRAHQPPSDISVRSSDESGASVTRLACGSMAFT